jgi:hypothetical protein
MDKKQKPVKVVEDVYVKNKHTDDLVDHYWYSINYVATLIKASEIKAGLILSFYGILLNFIYQGINLLLEQFPNNILIYVLLVLWFGFIVISIYFSIRCFIPRFEAKFDKNIFFFRDVISKFGDVDEFSNTFFEISKDEDRLFHQLGHQIYIVSKIANVKFRYVHLSLRFLAASLVVLLIASIYYFVISAV